MLVLLPKTEILPARWQTPFWTAVSVRSPMRFPTEGGEGFGREVGHVAGSRRLRVRLLEGFISGHRYGPIGVAPFTVAMALKTSSSQQKRALRPPPPSGKRECERLSRLQRSSGYSTPGKTNRRGVAHSTS